MRDIHQTLTITALEKKDIPALTVLEAQCFSACWTPHQYELFLESSGAEGLPVQQALQRPASNKASGFVFGVFCQQELIGYVSLIVQYPVHELEIFNIAVKESYRRCGIAKYFLRLIFDGAVDAGIRQAFLEVRETNVPALGLYSALGFTECGRRKKYYTDTGEDALLLSLALESSKHVTERE